MKKLVTLTGAALAIATFGAAPALAQTIVSVPVDGVIYGQPGTTHEFAVGNVPAEYVGWLCSGEAATDNNGSVHPNNDLIISTNGTTVTIPNVEDVPGVLHRIEGSLILGETIDVSVHLGSDGVSSGGFVIEFTCSGPAPTTTTTTEPVETTTTEAPPVETTATVPDSTTTAPPPSGPVITAPTSVTVAPISTAPPPSGPTVTLPVTGSSTTYMVASTGFALLGAGVALLALVRLAATRVRFNRAQH